MRYIELQRAVQSRLSELERLCERERSILMGRWKTHSLPARKRTPNSIAGTNLNQPSPSSSFNSSTIQCCRPATSTEHLLLYNVVEASYFNDTIRESHAYDKIFIVIYVTNFRIQPLRQI